MIVVTNKKETISFDIEGVEASASTDDNKLVKVSMVLANSEEENVLKANDEKFLRDIHKEVGKLLNHIDACRAVGRDDLDSSGKSPTINPMSDSMRDAMFVHQQENHLADMISFDSD